MRSSALAACVAALAACPSAASPGRGRPTVRCCGRSRSARPVRRRPAPRHRRRRRRRSRRARACRRARLVRRHAARSGRAVTIRTLDGYAVTLTHLGSIARPRRERRRGRGRRDDRPERGRGARCRTSISASARRRPARLRRSAGAAAAAPAAAPPPLRPRRLRLRLRSSRRADALAGSGSRAGAGRDPAGSDGGDRAEPVRRRRPRPCRTRPCRPRPAAHDRAARDVPPTTVPPTLAQRHVRGPRHARRGVARGRLRGRRGMPWTSSPAPAKDEPVRGAACGSPADAGARAGAPRRPPRGPGGRGSTRAPAVDPRDASVPAAPRTAPGIDRPVAHGGAPGRSGPPRRLRRRRGPARRSRLDPAPIINADALLPDDTDLLRELDAAHRACLHDERGGHPRAAPPPARRRDVLPHRRRRACDEGCRVAEEQGLAAKEYVDRSSRAGASCHGV